MDSPGGEVLDFINTATYFFEQQLSHGNAVRPATDKTSLTKYTKYTKTGRRSTNDIRLSARHGGLRPPRDLAGKCAHQAFLRLVGAERVSPPDPNQDGTTRSVVPVGRIEEQPIDLYLQRAHEIAISMSARIHPFHF